MENGADVTFGYRPVASGAFWLGKDGNVWVAGDKGVNNAGPWDDNTRIYWLSRGFELIDDPVNGGATAPSNPNGGGSTFEDKSNDIALQTAGLNASEGKLNTGLAKIDEALGKIIGQYDTESGANEKTYSTSSNQNQSNLQSAKQTALINAVQGRRGLFGTLASIGALGGTGIDLANRAVQAGANEDLTGAQDTYATNQTGLDTSIEGFRQEDKRRRQDANTAADDARTGARYDSAKEKQGFYSNLANDYAKMGNAGMAKQYADLAASLYPSMAASAVPSTNLAYSGAAFTAPALENYLSKGNMTVRTAPSDGRGIPGLIASNPFTGNKKKELVAA